MLAAAALCAAAAAASASGPSAAAPLPSPGQLRLAQRGYDVRGGAGGAVPPTMGTARLPVPEDGGCEVTLKKQLSATACVLGKTFGCNASASGGATIWTKGCRGIFSCDGSVIHAE